MRSPKRIAINKILAEYQHAKKCTEEEEFKLKEEKKKLIASQEAQEIFQSIAESIQASAHEQISHIVSRCLEAIFPSNEYEFKIRFKKARGKTEALLVLCKDGVDFDPLESCGGGVADVVSFALRLACLLLSQPGKRRLLVLDEPWKHLSQNHQSTVRDLVESLAKEFEIQFIIVTHSQELKIGRVVEL